MARQYRLHLHLAELHEARGELAEGLQHLNEYLKLKPQSIEPSVNSQASQMVACCTCQIVSLASIATGSLR